MEMDRESRLASAEEHLRLLPNVVRAKVVEGEDGNEIHVMVGQVLDQDDIKRLKKDIETVYLLDMGEKIDYRKVSIAQIPSCDEIAHSPVHSRPVLSRIALEYGPGGMMCAHVDLEHGNQTFSGNASGRSGEDQVCEIVKNATLRAVEQLIGDGLRLQAQCEMAGGRVVSEVAVSDSASGQKNRYIGAAYQKDDLPASVARSILQALNRQLEPRLDTRLPM